MAIRFVLALLVLVGGAAHASSDPATVCCASRLRTTAARERQLLRCHAQAAVHGVAVDPACVAGEAAALARSFARTEAANACPGPGDETLVQADLERIAARIAGALRPVPTASGCAARKLKAAGRLAQLTLRAFSQHPPHPADQLGTLDQIILAFIDRMNATFLLLDTRPGCLTTGDAATVANLVTIGNDVQSSSPDGALLAARRLCPRCGDGVHGGAEECDGIDAASCGDGLCLPTCKCASCGDGVRNQPSEVCDGADDAACHGLCRSDCTCPPPICGNGVKEAGEQCDGTDLGTACASCQADCTCSPPVCGNGIVEAGEECDGGFCYLPNALGPAGCTASCHCCDGGYCPEAGCCDPTDHCLPNPGGVTGTCFQTQCRPDRPCPSGYTCAPSVSDPNLGYCLGDLGSLCAYTSQITVCVPPAVCPSTILGFCCLPPGSACGGNSDCCSRLCSGGTCS
jgi:hypothetical protein